MEPLVIEILRWSIPIIIALVSLSYTILERRKQKEKSLKERYLESAQSNLNQVIEILRKIDVPPLVLLKKGFETIDPWGDFHGDVYTNVSELLRFSYDLGEKKITINLPYELTDYGETQESETKELQYKRICDFSSFSNESFSNFLSTHSFNLAARFEIPDFEQFWKNEINFTFFTWGLEEINSAKKKLLVYEEVYENLSPTSINNINNLFNDISSDILKTVQQSKTLEINLENFSNTDEIMSYLVENALNYSYIQKKFLVVNDIISELIKARKELFKLISR